MSGSARGTFPEVDPDIDFSPDGKYIAYNTWRHHFDSSSGCDPDVTAYCGAAETRSILVEGGQYNVLRSWTSIEFFAPVHVDWAPAVVTDSTKPTSTADAGSYQSGTWTNQDVTLTLKAEDEPNGSGVDKIFYNTDGSTNYQQYTAPLSFTSDTQTTVYYYATDKAGNKEDPPNTFTVKIDKTPPAVSSTSPFNNQIGVDPKVTITA